MPKNDRATGHPDPAAELALRDIAALDAVRSGARGRLRTLDDEVKDALATFAEAASSFNDQDLDTYEDAAKFLREAERAHVSRLERAYSRIDTESASLASMGAVISKKISEAGLTSSDLSFLQLDDGTRE